MYRKRNEAHAAFGIEAFYRLHQADIAFLNQIRVGQAVAQIMAGDRYDETQMGRDQKMRSLQIVVLLQIAAVANFFLLGEQGEAANGVDIIFKAGNESTTELLGKLALYI